MKLLTAALLAIPELWSHDSLTKRRPAGGQQKHFTKHATKKGPGRSRAKRKK